MTTFITKETCIILYYLNFAVDFFFSGSQHISEQIILPDYLILMV